MSDLATAPTLPISVDPPRRLRGADPLSRASRLRMLARLRTAAAAGDVAATEALVRLSLLEEGRRAARRLDGRK
jgi:hypothetical protein